MRFWITRGDHGLYVITKDQQTIQEDGCVLGMLPISQQTTHIARNKRTIEGIFGVRLDRGEECCVEFSLVELDDE